MQAANLFCGSVLRSRIILMAQPHQNKEAQAAPVEACNPTFKKRYRKIMHLQYHQIRQASFNKASYTEGGVGQDECAERSCRP